MSLSRAIPSSRPATEQLAQIHEQLQRGQSVAIGQVQAISGLGGIGKTQISIEYAYRHRQEYQAVLWVRADTLETLNSSYSELARLLNLREKDAREQEVVVQAVKTWLGTHRDWLLILDNLDEPLVLFPSDEKGQPRAISPFLPAAPGGHILLTTRSDDLSSLSLTLGLTRPLRITTFTPEQGAQLLLARAERQEQTTPQDQQLATQIANELGGLALAIDQAGAYLAATGASLASYLQLFQQRRADLLQAEAQRPLSRVRGHHLVYLLPTRSRAQSRRSRTPALLCLPGPRCHPRRTAHQRRWRTR